MKNQLRRPRARNIFGRVFGPGGDETGPFQSVLNDLLHRWPYLFLWEEGSKRGVRHVGFPVSHYWKSTVYKASRFHLCPSLVPFGHASLNPLHQGRLNFEGRYVSMISHDVCMYCGRAIGPPDTMYRWFGWSLLLMKKKNIFLGVTYTWPTTPRVGSAKATHQQKNKLYSSNKLKQTQTAQFCLWSLNIRKLASIQAPPVPASAKCKGHKLNAVASSWDLRQEQIRWRNLRISTGPVPSGVLASHKRAWFKFRFVHWQFTYRTMGEERPLTLKPSRGRPQQLWPHYTWKIVLGNVHWDFLMFHWFLFHVNVGATSSAKEKYWKLYNFLCSCFLPPSLHWARLRVSGLTSLY